MVQQRTRVQRSKVQVSQHILFFLHEIILIYRFNFKSSLIWPKIVKKIIIYVFFIKASDGINLDLIWAEIGSILYNAQVVTYGNWQDWLYLVQVTTW